LDVYSPKVVMDKLSVKGDEAMIPLKQSTPVIVWIYGGGYTAGDKTSQAGDPVGLLERSKDPVTGNPPVFVAMNYRVSGQ
jgi:carboxylesterase type B